MATREETFQTFSEICQRARDIEKKPFSSPPGQIAGSIPQGSESNIFPKETEEYTYAYLLAESQKIERKLSFSSFSPQKTSAPSQPQPRAGEDRKVESELHQLASQKYLYPEKKGAPEQALDDNVPPVFVKQALPSQPKVPSGRAAKPPPSIPISGGAREARILPKPIYAPETPAQTEGDAPGHESEAPLPPVPFPPSRAKIRETPENEEQQLEKEEVPLPPLPQDEDAAPEKTQPLGTAIQAEAPPKPGASKLVLSSKLSPRLRAIIEEKLKREEQARSESENPKLEKEIIPAEKEARPTEERAEQEEPAEKELQAEKEERAEPETPQRDSAPVPVARRKARPEKAQLQDDGPQSISPSEGVQSETSEPKEIPQQEQEPGAAVPASAPAPSQRRPGMVIRPVFKDQSAGAVDIPQAPSADSQKRLLRIQQILGELSSERDSSSPPDELMAELARKKQDAKIKKAQSRASPEPEPEEQPEPKITPMPSKSKKQKEKPSLEKGKQATASKKKTKVSAKKQAPVEQVPEEPSLEEQAPAKLPAREPAPAKAISRKSIQPYPAPPQKEEGESEEPQLQEKSEEQTSPPAQQMRPVPRSNAVPARRQTASPSQAQKTPLSKRQPATAPSQKTKPQRILPGGRLVPSVAPKTFIPLARKSIPAVPTYSPSDNGEAESRLPPAKKQPASPPQEASAINAPAQASEKSMPAPPPIPKPPVFSQQLSSGNRPTVTPKEVSGTANLPQEDDLEIPKPPAEIVQPSPSQGEYEMAKGDLRVKLSQEDKEEAARQEAESMLEQYARQNIVWLYEIYKMGGLSREEFLQKVKEKMADGKKEAPEPAAQNNALSNLGREIDKKYNK